MEFEEIALSLLRFRDVANDTIVKIGSLDMPQGTKFNDLAQSMGHTYKWELSSLANPKPCMMRAVPSPTVIVARDNSVSPAEDYDVEIVDYAFFSIFNIKAHPDRRPPNK